MDKQCTKCGLIKPLVDYYKHPKGKNGLYPHCKACHRLQCNLTPRRYNAETHRKSSARWAKNNPEKRKEVTARYREKNRERVREAGRVSARKQYDPAAAKEKRKRDAPRRLARSKLNNAVIAGILQRPTSCEKCGMGGRIEAHHTDYSKPLRVSWLCSICHAAIHMEKNECQASI